MAVGWVPGPRTQIEIKFCDGKTLVRYAPGYRSTVRVPVRPRRFDMRPIDARIAQLRGDAHTRAVVLAGGAKASPFANLKTLGGLLQGALQEWVANELDRDGLYLELGIAEDILGYPWELMWDGEDYLCLRHNVSRYVDATAADMENTAIPSWWEAQLAEIRVLTISVPNPEPRKDRPFGALPAVVAETSAIEKAVAAVPGCRSTVLHAPTIDELYETMMGTKFHVVHYCGHAEFGGANEHQGRLILQNEDLSASNWQTLLQRTEAVVCVLNGCETARQDAAFNAGRYGLARAVLDTGAYLVGTAWSVEDAGAEAFARTFYGQFLGEHAAIGAAVRAARNACRLALPDAPAWASYVLYGDPRLRLETIAEATGAAAGSSSASATSAVQTPPG